MFLVVLKQNPSPKCKQKNSHVILLECFFIQSTQNNTLGFLNENYLKEQALQMRDIRLHSCKYGMYK